MINILLFNSSSVTLNDGFTLNDYIIRANANNVSYDRLCWSLGITVGEAKASYDKTWNIPLEAVGTIKPNLLLSAIACAPKLKCVRTGTDWRHTT